MRRFTQAPIRKGIRNAGGGLRPARPLRRRPVSAIAVVAGAATLLLTLAAARPAAALTPAELIGPDLQPHPVSLAGLRDGRISFFDRERRLRSEPAEQYVQIRGIGGSTAGAPAPDAAADVPVLELVDGQRLVGEWLGGDSGGAAVRWMHPLLGEVAVPLEDIRALSRTGNLRQVDPDAAAIDTVVTANGDALRGFIAAVDAEAVTIEPDAVDQSVRLPIDRVHGLRLANPVSERHRPTAGQHLVVLRDGSRLLGNAMEISDERLVFRPELVRGSSTPVPVPLRDVARVDLVGAGWELVELASRRLRLTDGGEVFGVAMPPRVEGRDVLLHAPVSVDVELPDAATRLSATARLDLDPSALATDWADVEIVIPAADPAASDHRYRLDASQPEQPINVPLGGRLLIQLDPGVNGPILDRLRLTDGVLLLRHEVDPATPD